METFDSLYMTPLKEMATHEWEIKSHDRAWYISPEGILYSGTTHASILQNQFAEDWNKIAADGIDGWQIHESLEKRMIKVGFAMISEIKDKYYSTVYQLDLKSKDNLQGFCKSVISSTTINMQDTPILIEEQQSGLKHRYTLSQVANDVFDE